VRRGVFWDPDAWQDYLSWHESDPDIVKKINALIKDCLREPFRGLGKPEPLKRDLQGYWSRRITQSDWLVYRVDDYAIHILQCKEHYLSPQKSQTGSSGFFVELWPEL
jgi:toxin YoeB